MTRDYAKKTPPPPTKRGRLWLSALIILVLVLSIPTLFYIHYMHMPHAKGKIIPNPQFIQKPSSLTQSQNQYDFYSMLQHMKVNVKQGAPSAIQIPTHQPYYLLQVALSSDAIAAQELVTKLGVMGLDASIQKVINKNGDTRYRVVAGPYLKNKNALIDQAYLRSNHINSMRLRINNYPKQH